MLTRKLAILFLLLPVAQEPAPPTATPSTIRCDATAMVLPAGKHEVRALVDATARFLKRNILFDEAELSSGNGKPIELQNPITVDAAGCEEVVSQLLWARGFVLAARDEKRGLYSVVSMMGQRAGEVMANARHLSVEEVLAGPTLMQPVATLLPLQNIDVNMAINSLRPFLVGRGMGVTVGSVGTNNALLIEGLQRNVADVVMLVRKADARYLPPAFHKDFHLRIDELERTVKDLAHQVAVLQKRPPDSK